MLYIHLEKDPMPYFSMFLCRIFVSSGQNYKLIRREDGFLKNSKITFMSEGDSQTLTLKISVANSFRFRHF